MGTERSFVAAERSIMGDLYANEVRERSATAVAPGAVWLRRWLPLDAQRALVTRCRELMDGPAGGYVPTVRGGGRMRVRMLCLGRHWNPLTYHDDAPVAAVPADWIAMASAMVEAAGRCQDSGLAPYSPDICLISFYGIDGRMGLHQDKDESAASLQAGQPVVSVSIGDTARFMFGGFRRRDEIETILLESGDVFVFGGASRLRYHGVSRIVPGTAPASLELQGRFNLTFRQY
jgi:DNA alkylation damage repair protein AlkB